MATKNDKTRPSSFYELVLCAPEDLALGFLSGLALGAGHDAVLAHGPDEDIAGPGLGDRLKTALRVHPQETHVVVDNVTRGLVKRKAKQMFADTGIELVSERKVRSARFDFRYHVYASRYTREIDALLKALPKGLRLVNHDREETLDPSAKGPEAYTPTHHYELKGCGTAVGRFDAILRAHHTLDTHPLVSVEEIELDLV